MDWRQHPWAGVNAAILCPFHSDESIDEPGLSVYAAELATTEGLKGLTCNGHTGEIMSLRPDERARVTRIVVEAVGRAGGYQAGAAFLLHQLAETMKHPL